MKFFSISLLVIIFTGFSQLGLTTCWAESAKVAVTDNHTAPVNALKRIKIASVGSHDIGLTKKLYSQWLDYNIVEEGMIPNLLATSWGTPAMAGKPYALLQGKSGDDVYLRVIEVTAPKAHKAMTTFGWNAIEIIVENPDAIYEKLINSPFIHIGGPANLNGGKSSIRAVQFKGPSEEVFYFTTDTGDRSKSTLLTPRAEVDRPFIMVLAGPDAQALSDYYVSTFGALEAFSLKTPIDIVAKAQNRPPTHLYPLHLIRLGEFSNSIEIDGYPANSGSRTTAEGELPPGVSITTFAVSDLSLIDASLFVSTPITVSGAAYSNNRTATIIGPAGELIELIEEK